MIMHVYIYAHTGYVPRKKFKLDMNLYIRFMPITVSQSKTFANVCMKSKYHIVSIFIAILACKLKCKETY